MSTETTGTEIVQQTANDTALYLITKAEIDTQIATARAFPRQSMKMFMDEVLSLATITEEVAESCTFAMPRGGKLIEGPSVRLAEIIAHCYGNIRYGSRVIENDGRTITSQGICHDLEKNVAYTIEEKRSIMQHETKWENGKSHRTGNMVQMNDDMQVMIGRVNNSIAKRNAIMGVVPKAIWMPLYDQVKQVAKGTAATLKDRREKAVAWFKEQGIKNEQICAVLEIKKVEDIDLEKLYVLSGMRSAIKNGESTLKEMFDPAKAAPAPETAKPSLTDDEVELAVSTGQKLSEVQAQYSLTPEQIKMFKP